MTGLIAKGISLYKEKFILSRSIIVITASFFANIFSYLFQLISGRYFTVEEYATLVSLFSLSGVIPWTVQFFMNGVPKIVAEIKDDDYPHRISVLFYSILKLNLIASITIFLILVLSTSFISEYLRINNTKLIIVFSLAVSTGTLMSFMPMFLQGLLRFKALSFITFTGGFTKFLVALVVTILGLSISHIFGGLILTTFFIGFLSSILLRKNITNKAREFGKDDIKLLVKYSVGGAFTLAGLALLQNNDVILVKHFFDAQSAGIYSSTSIIGRIVFYAASPVGIVMLPICAEKYKKGEDFNKPFITALLLSIFIAGVGTMVYWLFPHLVISLLFGAKYLAAEPFLPIYGIFMLLYTLLAMVAWFLIAVSKFKLGALTLGAAALQYAGIQIFNNSLQQVIYTSISSISIVLLIIIPILIRDSRSKLLT